MTIFGREPVAWIGVIVALAITIIQTLLGQGVIDDAIAGRAVDATNALAQLASIFIPIILGILATRPATTPLVSPAVPSGTNVTVYTPGVKDSGVTQTVTNLPNL